MGTSISGAGAAHSSTGVGAAWAALCEDDTVIDDPLVDTLRKELEGLFVPLRPSLPRSEEQD